jgi:hypothetical protein
MEGRPDFDGYFGNIASHGHWSSSGAYVALANFTYLLTIE